MSLGNLVEWINQPMAHVAATALFALIALLGIWMFARRKKTAEAFVRALLDASPVLTEFWDADANLIDCNSRLMDICGFSDKEEFIKRYYEFSPEYQPCGSRSKDKVKKMIETAQKQGVCRVEWIFTFADGDMPVDVTLVPVRYEGRLLYASYAYDLRPIKSVMAREREAHEINAIFMESGPFILNIWNDDINLVSTSPQSAKMFGLRSEEEYIERFFDLSPEFQPCGEPSDIMALNYVKQAFKEGYAQFEWLHQTLDGENVPAEITLVRFTRGERDFVAAYTTDLRPVKEAMDRERDAIGLTQILMDTSPALIEIWDGEHNFLDCNKRMLDIYGIADRDEFWERYPEFMPEFQPCGTTSVQKGMENIKKALKHGVARYEWMRLLPGGEELPTEVVSYRVERDDKTLIVSYNNDLRQVKYDMNLENERIMAERMRLMFDATPLLIEYWDRDFNVIDCNKTTLNFYGFKDRREYLARIYDSMPDFQGISPWDVWNGYLTEIFENSFADFEFVQQKPNGDMAFMEVKGVRIKYNNEIVAVTYSNDVTRLKELQNEQRRIEVAEESNMAKSRFLARMSHEIRTPITAVLGISEIQLQNTDLNPTIEESFVKIHTSAHNLLGIVNDILDLSKIEAGKMAMLNDEYEVASMISDVAQMHMANLGSRKIKFRMRVDENLPAFLIGDALRIEQIMNNLLSNAFKYTEVGTVELAVSYEEMSDGYIMLIISINDTGMGMTKEQLKAIHYDYTRFHEREFRAIGGTGLGMSIVYNLAQMMDAQIDLKSEVGQGTRIIVRIPQKVVSDEVLGKETARNLQQFDSSRLDSKRFKFVPEPMGYGRVLVVDDVEANLYVAKGLLNFYELNIETCESGYAAIELIKEGRVYDIVFMDHMMPGMSGAETMQVLRDIGYDHPIVALTANALIGQAEEFIALGFDDFIAKPIQTKQLNSVLTRFIRDKQPPEVLEAARTPKARLSAAAHRDIDGYLGSELGKLRLDFAKSHRHTFDDIRDALDRDQVQTAHRLVHNIKGLAGLIAEDALADIAAQIEQLLATGHTYPHLGELEAEMERVLESIDIPEADDGPAPDLDAARATAIFDELTPLLMARNLEALDLLDELRRIPESAVLVSQIEQYEFVLAAKTLENLRGILDV